MTPTQIPSFARSFDASTASLKKSSCHSITASLPSLKFTAFPMETWLFAHVNKRLALFADTHVSMGPPCLRKAFKQPRSSWGISWRKDRHRGKKIVAPLYLHRNGASDTAKHKKAPEPVPTKSTESAW
jgi:hypothetical protein